MEFTKQITIKASADQVWKIIGTDFNNISEWSSLVLTSEANPDVPEGGGRICNVNGFGKVVENIFEYDDSQRELAFTLEADKNPFFMPRIENSWHVEPQGDNQSVVEIGVHIKMMPVFKQLMSGRLSKIMQKRADGILNELKDFAEKAAVTA